MRYILALLLIINFCFYSFAQFNKNGLPFITNYSPQTYEASEQNWAIVQDNRGIMYFGNNDHGILEYDGVNWRKIPIKNNTIVRSLAIDSLGVIYVGSVNDFGYLSYNNSGKAHYESLLYLVDSSKSDFADVWKTFVGDSGVYFSSEKYIFNYANQKLKQYPTQGAIFSFAVNNNIFIGSYKKGLLTLNKGEVTQAKGGDFFMGKGIYTLNNFNHKIVIGTYPEGLFNYDVLNGKTERAFNGKYINKFVNDYQIYQSCIYDSIQMLFGTIQNGVILINEKGDITHHYNMDNGLQDETIINLYTDITKNVWLALNNGISKIEQNSALGLFSDMQGIRGNVVDICEFNGRIFVATTLGVFYQNNEKNNTPNFIQIENLKVSCLSLLPINYSNDNHLLVGTNYGLYRINSDFSVNYIDKQIIPKEKELKTNYIQKLYKSHINKDEVYVATFEGVFSIKYNQKKWGFIKYFPLEGFDIRYIVEDENDNIWFATFMNGIIKCVGADTSKMVFYGIEQGLPSMNQNILGIIDRHLAVGTKRGLYIYSEDNDRFIKDSSFQNIDYSIYYFNQDQSGNVWFSADKDQKRWVEMYENKSKNYNKNDIPFKRLPNQLIDVIFHATSGITWFGSSSGLSSFNSRFHCNYAEPFNCLIRKLTTQNDSILFEGAFYKEFSDGVKSSTTKQNNIFKLNLDYAYNDLTFEFAAPYFVNEQKTKYSFVLEGYKDDEWSKWSSETKAIYTNLNEGKYTFKAKAKNIYAVESSIAEFSFTIAPPWYRTILAFVFYGIIGILIIYIIVKIYTHKLELDKIRLEGIVHERTAEIRKQKEDIEQKNELLEKQKAEILGQKEEITASIHYAQRIQKAIVPTETEAARLLNDYFLLWKPRDIVSGDYWWLGEKDGYVIATAADCTGHGVPGAFMSMLGVSFLNEIVKQQGITNSNEILNHMREKVKITLGQTGEANTSKDGMDMALLVLDFKNMKAEFSGAYNPLYLYRNGELLEIKANRNPIAVYIKEQPFTKNNIELQKGDTLYMFSDGYPDQFGGEKEKKYSTKRFKQLLLGIQDKSMEEQKAILNKEIEEWRGCINQIDDIIVLGIRV